MTNETQNGCCGGKPSDNKASGTGAEAAEKTCCDSKKGGCGPSSGKCLCGKANCCCHVLCKVLALLLVVGLAWYGWQAQGKVSAVCTALAAGEQAPAIPAPEAELQDEVNELQDKVVESAREQKSIEGQYIEHLQSTLSAVKRAAACR